MATSAGFEHPVVVWLRRDLRLADNLALQAAVASKRPVIALFILEDEPPVRGSGAAGLWWLDKSLRALAADLEGRGSRLLLRRGEARSVLDAVIEETGAGSVIWNRSYEPPMDARDRNLAEALRTRGLEVCSCEGKLLLDPGQVRTKTGGPYGVFTPFWRTASGMIPPLDLQGAPKVIRASKVQPRSEALEAWGLHPSHPDWSGGFGWTPGEAGAKAALDAFLTDKLATYPHDRDRPAVDGSSRLSPHLNWGEITPRQIHCTVQARLAAHGLETQAQKFLSELGWREFDYGLLAQQPALHQAPFKRALSGIEWRKSPSDLEAWRRGCTGYPIVDAGMRQLWSLGWMHNRVRLITSSFLVKHLLIDWREGEAWFWDCLVDGDPANNPANWQWIAGTGADAQPFFRIFNPVTQGEKFDPDGDYVRQWVPELAKAHRRWIHAPWTASEAELAEAGLMLGRDYPKPIVAHEQARTRALEALKATRQAA
ncbi:deoxyribodipyrimidine photo-lyase [Caulobacter sp. S45]|uniref:cryptochrome/photolyase family protein n=1 Tax=Caulobacter sp. S45 TaxID=1641861 RepID=UPI0015769258|nr:deoxyribodipyrimidine photo-lyase [Caulobacter sp. S45]